MGSDTFSCKVCERTYGSKIYIKNHECTSRPCEKCGRIFKTNELLKSHNKTKCKNFLKNFPCPLCTNFYSSKRAAIVHMKKKHGYKSEPNKSTAEDKVELEVHGVKAMDAKRPTKENPSHIDTGSEAGCSVEEFIGLRTQYSRESKKKSKTANGSAATAENDVSSSLQFIGNTSLTPTHNINTMDSYDVCAVKSEVTTDISIASTNSECEDGSVRFAPIQRKRQRHSAELAAPNKYEGIELLAQCVNKFNAKKEDEYDFLGNIVALRTRKISQANRATFRRVQRDIMALLDAADDENESRLKSIIEFE